jgi:hypothetical protein
LLKGKIMNSSHRWISRSSLVALTLAVVSGCSASAANPDDAEDIGESASAITRIAVPPPATITLHGSLGRLSVGRLQSTGQGGGVRFVLRTSDGKLHSVTLSASVIAAGGGLKTILGKQVTLSGTKSAQGSIVAQSVTPDSNVVAASAGGPVQQIGTKRLVTLLCRFSDLANPDPHTPDYFRSLMGPAAPGVGDFWSKASRGQLTVDGSAVTEWTDMPQPFSEYQAMPPDERFGALLGDCIGTGFGFVDYDAFDGITMAFSHNIEQQVSGGSLPLTFGGPTRDFAIAVLSPVEFANQASTNRTLGIGLGVSFSGSAPLQYDSPWDVMSAGFGTTNGSSCRALSSSFGCTSALPLAEDALRAGWITPAQVANVAATGSATVDLDFVGNAPLPGHFGVVHMPIDATHFYTVEARNQVAGSYDFAVPSTNLVIHTMDATVYDTPNEQELLDATHRLRLLAAPAPGATSYLDEARKFRLDFTKQSFGYRVTITRGFPLTIVSTGGSARITGGGVNCVAGSAGCTGGVPINTTVTLSATPTDPTLEVKSWFGCTSVLNDRCTVTVDRAKSVTVRLGSAPVECVCLPSWPAYKCEDICGGYN